MDEDDLFCEVCDSPDQVRWWDQNPTVGPCPLCSRHYRDWSDLFGVSHQDRQWTGEAS